MIIIQAHRAFSHVPKMYMYVFLIIITIKKTLYLNIFACVKRFPVPINKISWDSKFLDYNPNTFTAEKIYSRKEGDYKDPSE